MGIEKLKERLWNLKWHMLGGVLVLAAWIGFLSLMETTKEFRVHLMVEGEEHVVLSTAASVEELLRSQGVMLNADTFVSEPLDAVLSTDMKISVIQPKKATVVIGNQELEVFGFSKNVSDILKRAGLELDQDDYTEPPMGAELKDGEVLKVFRVGKFERAEEEEIPFGSEERINKELNKGRQKEIQAGVNGKKKTVYEITFVNGQMTERKTLSEEVIRQPIDRIVEKGSKPIVVASRGSDTHRRIKDVEGTGEVGKDGVLSDGTPYQKVIMMSSTAYDNSPAQNGGYTKTALGTPLRKGVIAVDPKVIPLGTRVYVENLDGYPDYGYAVAEDVGSAIKGNRIDVCMGSGPTKPYGRRNVRVYILGK